jgi:thiol:disulfide interchange protein/DsbC/DsbD-like thiol-disulfide interchange protein
MASHRLPSTGSRARRDPRTSRPFAGDGRATRGRPREVLPLALLTLALLLAAGPAAFAAPRRPAEPPRRQADQKVRAELVSEVASVEPGRPFWVALRQRIAPGWHTYWRNPGDTGEPVQIAWSLPAGAAASEIAWPVPERIATGPATSYGFTGEVLLPVEITPPATLVAGGTMALRATASWLVCEKECIPEEATVALDLPVAAGPPARDGKWGAALEAARAAVPRTIPWPVTARVDAEAVALVVTAPGLRAERLAEAWFYPLAWGLIDHAAPQALSVSADGLALRIPRGPLPEAAQRPVEGVLVLVERLDGSTARQAFALRAGPGDAASPLAGAWPWPSIVRAVALALAGGLILNLMPCVLPVLSVKALALVGHRAGSRRAMRIHGLAYSAGVLLAFGAVAGALLGLRAAGEQVGWGFHLQSPGFVAALAYLLFAMALALSGVLALGDRLAGLGGGLAARAGYAGSFLTGVLATVVATPCTAPFMGTAVGFALTQPAPVALAVLEALGVGLALPYLALSVFPGWARVLPEPGEWMRRLEQLLAFPLYASVAWLIWVLARQVGPRGLAAALAGLVLLALAAWLQSTARQAGGALRLGARASALTGMLAAVAMVGLVAGDAAPSRHAAAAGAGADGGVVWEPYSPARLAELRARGVPVFVNVTAAWCITCLVNERVALGSAEVVEGFARKRVVALRADWTSRDAGIARVLAQFDRSGVPLYVLYATPGRARVLPQVLTPGIVLDAIRDL